MVLLDMIASVVFHFHAFLTSFEQHCADSVYLFDLCSSFYFCRALGSYTFKY